MASYSERFDDLVAVFGAFQPASSSSLIHSSESFHSFPYFLRIAAYLAFVSCILAIAGSKSLGTGLDTGTFFASFTPCMVLSAVASSTPASNRQSYANLSAQCTLPPSDAKTSRQSYLDIVVFRLTYVYSVVRGVLI